MSVSNLNNAISYFQQTYFAEDGYYRNDLDIKYLRFFQKLGLINNNRGKFSQKSQDEIKEIVKRNLRVNPYYEFLFCQTMCPNGIDTIFPLILKGGKTSLSVSAFDPIKNRCGDNRGTLCRIIYKHKIHNFIAGNGSMRNVKNEGNTFFAAIGLNEKPFDLDKNVKFSVVHKMDGRYVALYISKIMTDSGAPATIMTIHSRKGVIIGSGVYIDGPLDEMSNFRAEFDFIRKDRVAMVNEDGSPKLNAKGKQEYDYVEKIVFSRSFSFVSEISDFVPSTISRKTQKMQEDGSIIEQTFDDSLIGTSEIKTAFDISKKVSHLVGLDEMMLVNCEGTKDNMRPLFDKYITENQELFQGLFPHPFSTVVYDLSSRTPDPTTPKKYLSDPRIFSDNGINYCQIFSSPSGNLFWNTNEILEGLVQKDVQIVFDNNSQKLFGLVDYVNKLMLSFLQSKGKYSEFNNDIFPGHICEGVILGAHLADGSFAYMKVKDELFADEEEQTMKLESI